MTHSQEREQRKLAYYAEPQNGALKRNIRHILGISGGKYSTTPFLAILGSSDGVKRNKHANGKLLLGEVIQQMPEKMAV